MGALKACTSLVKGQSASLTFKDPGVYSYNCALHPNMKGAVEVKK